LCSVFFYLSEISVPDRLFVKWSPSNRFPLPSGFLSFAPQEDSPRHPARALSPPLAHPRTPFLDTPDTFPFSPDSSSSILLRERISEMSDASSFFAFLSGLPFFSGYHFLLPFLYILMPLTNKRPSLSHLQAGYSPPEGLPFPSPPPPYSLLGFPLLCNSAAGVIFISPQRASLLSDETRSARAAYSPF